MKWDSLGIDVSKVRGGKTTCPKCSPSRKHKNDPCLSVDLKTGLYNCHNCQWRGTASETVRPKKDYTLPPPRLEKVGSDMIAWFEGRGISNNTLLRFGITESKEWMPQTQKEMNCICFNYYRGGQLVNIKFRDGAKNFKLVGGAELILYNLDALDAQQDAIIVEGEIDSLSMYESGLMNSVSVPNGASRGSQKLEYMDSCWESFEGIGRIYLCTDNDDAGIALREELARRLGKDRCWLITYPEGCKDANEVLIRHGKEAVKQMITNAYQYPLDGIATMADMAEGVMSYYVNGFPKGKAAGIKGFDEALTFLESQLTIVTGIPSHGKDEMLNYIAVGLAKNAGWKFGVAGFEEPADITTTKLIEKHGGKSFAEGPNPNDRLSMDDVEKGMLFLDDMFYFIKTDEIDVTIDGVLEKFGQLVRRYGINAMIISPWNCFEHKVPPGMTGTDYVGMSLQKIIRFCKLNNVHCFLIAHPTKMKKESGKYEVPTLNNISGSYNFFAMTHNGICVYRHLDTGRVDVHIQKVKFWWLGKMNTKVSFQFNGSTRQYELIEKKKAANLTNHPPPVKKLPDDPDEDFDEEEPF